MVISAISPVVTMIIRQGNHPEGKLSSHSHQRNGECDFCGILH